MNSPHEALHQRRVAEHRQRVQAKKQQIAQADRPIQAAVKLKYGPQEDLVNRQIAQSQLQQGRINDYYGAYQQAVQAAVQQQQQAQQQAQSSLSGEAERSNQTDANARTQLQGQMQQSAQQRGGTVDPNIAATGIQAEASRRAGIQSALANVGQQGAAAVSRTAGQGPIGEQRRILAQQGESGRQQTLRQGLQSLKGQEADYAQGLRQQQAKDALNAAIAQAGLGIKQSQLGIAQQNANTAATVGSSLTRHRTQQDVLAGKKFSSAQARDDYLRAHGLGPYRPPKAAKGPKGRNTLLTTNQQNTFVNQVDTAIASIRNLQGFTDASGKTPSSSEIRGWLQLGGTVKGAKGSTKVPKVNHDAINFAYDILTFGGLSPANVHRVKDLRLNSRRLPQGWLTGYKPPKPPPPPPTASGPTGIF